MRMTITKGQLNNYSDEDLDRLEEMIDEVQFNRTIKRIKDIGSDFADSNTLMEFFQRRKGK